MTLLLSLFPGIGLLDRAFEEEGFCVVRGPDVLWGGDVHRFHPPAGKFDGVIGGPPCQAFSSLVHLVRANGHEPRFGNLIPEYERCVREAAPAWFLMENVPAAPVPTVEGYGVHSFAIDNSRLDSGDGFGHEQRRERRFSFGTRGREAPNLMRWIDLAVFVLPDPARSVTSELVNNSPEAKVRIVSPPVTAGHEQPAGLTASRKTRPAAKASAVFGDGRPTRREVRAGAVTGSDGGPSLRMGRYKLADAYRLQGLPEDFLADCPLTAEGKLKAVANGVPITMGRALARAIRQALDC